jgi:hypothetical protein
LKAVGKDVRECRNIPKVVLDVRGGSDRSYDYNQYEREYRDDYSSKYGYGSSSAGKHGPTKRYGYDEDDYGDDISGQKRKRSSDEDDYYGYERDYTPIVSTIMFELYR